jgi:hypothetical protein
LTVWRFLSPLAIFAQFLPLIAVEPSLECPDSLPEAFRKLRDTAGAKQDHNDQEDNQNLGPTESDHENRCE